MRKKNILFITIGIILTISVVVLIGYLSSKNKSSKKAIQETEERITPSPSLVTNQTSKDKSGLDQTTKQTKELEKYQLLLDKPVIYIDLDYPVLYFYDPGEGLIEYLNLEDETYKEIAKFYDIDSINISPDKQKFVFKINNDFYLLNTKKDTITRLPVFTRSYSFTLDKIIVYISDYKNFSYLAYLDKNNKTTEIRNIGLLSPQIDFLPPDKILIYNDEGITPVFLMDLKKMPTMTLFLEPKENYSILPNKNGDLIFVSSEEGSKIINLKNETLINFPWQTTKEKCTFDDLLICSVAKNFSYKGWHLFDFNTDNKIVIYNPKTNEIKEVNLETMFDIIKPKLTPLGLIFGNRLDGKIYLLKI